MGRGVLDRPVKPDDDSVDPGSAAHHAANAARCAASAERDKGELVGRPRPGAIRVRPASSQLRATETP
jgi:hypothetical protein